MISAALIAGAAALAGCGGPRTATKSDWHVPAPKEAPAPPPARAVPIDPALQAAARAELDAAVASRSPEVRAHAIEALAQTAGPEAKAVYLKALSDPHELPRSAAVKAVGQLQIAEARQPLAGMVNESHPLVRIAVRYALHRLGDTRYTHELEQTARDPHVWQVRAETAVILGMLGEPTAVRVLRPMQRDPQPAVRLQVAEALWRLGDERGLRSLVSATQSGYPDDQMLALLALAQPRDTRVMGHVRAALTADYAEARVVAARAMGLLGSDAGYAIALDEARSADVYQRHRAAMALGDIGRSDAQGVLADLLREKDAPDVRLAAARGLLRLKAPGPASTARGG
jgi:HEAT repeat protein